MGHTTGTAPESMSFRGERYRDCRHRRRAIAPAVGLALLTGLWGFSATAGQWDITPSLEIVETYTDNVDLVSQQEPKTKDFVTRITPGISVVGEGARASFNLVYSPSLLIFAKSSKESDFRQFLNGKGNAELSEDLLFLDAAASINQQFLDRGGAISSNQDNATINRRTVQTYTISPYLKRDFGTVASAVLRYRGSYSDVSLPPNSVQFNDILKNTFDHNVSLRFDSGPQFSRLTWSAEAVYNNTDRGGNQPNGHSTTERVFGNYQVSRWMKLVASAGYENIHDLTSNRRPNGFIWDAGVTLTPGPRTTLTVRGGRRYGEQNWTGELEYKFSDRTVLSAGYVSEITTIQRILVGELLNNPDGIVADPGGFSLVNGAFKRNRAYANLRGRRGRSTFLFSGFWERRLPELNRPREDNYGGSVHFTRRFSRYLTGEVGGTYQKSKYYDALMRRDNFYSANANVTVQLSQSISGGLTYFFTYRNSTLADRDLRENAVKINLKATF